MNRRRARTLRSRGTEHAAQDSEFRIQRAAITVKPQTPDRGPGPHDREPRTTPLARFCAALLEACWLIAVVAVPLLFNVRSQQVFEPDKTALLRTLAMVMAAAWLILTLEPSAGPRPRLNPLAVLPAAIFGGSWLLSTALSLEPGMSWWGTHAREQGSYTMVCYLVIFGAVAFNLRRREQLERVAAAVVLTGFVVSLYAVLQRFGLDPIPWSQSSTEQVRSSLGNSSFAGGFLALSIPLALRGLWQSMAAVRENTDPDHSWKLARAAAYAGISILELAALWSTGSRGPILGLTIGLFLALVLLAFNAGRRAVLAMFGLETLALALAAAVYLPAGPLHSVRELGILGRLSHVFDQQDQTGQIRLVIWSGTAQAVQPHSPLVYPDGHTDRLNVLRPLLGYGPEMVYQVFSHFAPARLAELGPDEQWDRSHNQTFEALLTTGALGLLAYLALFGAAFGTGVACLGVLGPGDRWRFTLLLTMAIGATTAVAVSLRGVAYLGLSAPIGLLAGVFVYLAYAVAAGRRVEADRPRSLLLTALLAAIAAHFVETQVSFPTSVTWLYFWVYLALVVGTGNSDLRIESSEVPLRRSAFGTRHSALAPPAVAVMAIVFDFTQAGAAGLALLLAVAAVAAGMLLLSDARSALVTGGTAGGVGFLFAIYQLTSSNAAQLQVRETVEDVVRRSLVASQAYTGLTLALLLLAVGAAVAASMAVPGGRVRSRTSLGAAGAIFLAALSITYFTNVRLIRADMLFDAALPFAAQQDWQTVIALQQEGLRLAPGEDRLHTDLGGSFVQASAAVDSPQQRDRLLNAALAELTSAQRLNPLYPLHTENLAKLWQQWALDGPRVPDAQVRAQRARDLYAISLRLAPNAPGFRADWEDFERQWRDAAAPSANDP